MTATRLIGDIETSPMGFGGWAIGGPFATADGDPLGWGEVDDDESIAALRTAFENGITLFDTANVYGAGHSEKIIARALGDYRSQILIATKWGFLMEEGQRIAEGMDATVAGMHRSLEGSLRRLGTDYVDLFQFHINDFDAAASDDLRDALESLADEGKIRSYGWSTDFPDRARSWVGGKSFKAIQAEINVLSDNPAIWDVAEANSLACLNRGPLAMGLLGGKYRAESRIRGNDIRALSPDWLRYFDDGVPKAEFLSRLDAVREILTSGGRSLVQGAIAWLWGRSPTAIPIPGIRTVAQAKENSAAMALGPLTKPQMEEVASLMR